MTVYETEFEIPGYFPVGDLPSLMEGLRGQAFAKILHEYSDDIPRGIRIVWDTDGEFSEFDIVEHIAEVEANHPGLTIPRPTAEDAPETIAVKNPLSGPIQ